MNKEETKTNYPKNNGTADYDKVKDNSRNNFKYQKGLLINSLHFKFPHSIVEVWVSATEKPTYRRFHTRKLPNYVHDIIDDLTEENPFVWLSISKGDNDKLMKAEIKHHPALAKYWLSERVYQYLQCKLRLTKIDFMGDHEYWHEEKELHKKDLLAFSRFSIKIETFRDKNYSYLWLSYNGVSFVIEKSVEELVNEMQMDTIALRNVVYDKQLHNYKYLSDEIRFHTDEIYPVLRREIAEKTGLELNYHHEKYKLTKSVDNIEMFFNKYINTDDFKKIIPHKGKWRRLREDKIFYLKDRSRDLIFGQNHKDNNIFNGIKAYGSAQFVKYRHIKWFLIYRDEDGEKADLLKDFVSGKKGFIRLSIFTGTNLVHDEDHDILIKEGNNFGNTVRDKIKLMEMETDTTYFAFYLSPFRKTDTRPLEHSYYYKIKEALLSRDIMSQAIDINKFEERSFGLSMTNIGIAMTAKLGGVPWRLPNDKNKELIIGFGAYKSRRIGVSYVGSAFCFDNMGIFQEFDCWPADQEWALHTTLADAVQKYRLKNPDIERIVIHYYKDMKRKELRKIDELLDDLDEKIPVIVIRFNSSFNNNELIINAGHEKYLPENGCYVRLKNHQYLLHINTNENGIKCKDAPFPLKLSLQSNRAGLLNDGDLVERLMRQVYEFSMLHWRSVNQPKIPVTVAYPRMVAEIFPWFDADVLPDAARRSLWFL